MNRYYAIRLLFLFALCLLIASPVWGQVSNARLEGIGESWALAFLH